MKENGARERWAVNSDKKPVFYSVLCSIFLFFTVVSVCAPQTIEAPDKIELSDEAISETILGNGLSVLVKPISRPESASAQDRSGMVAIDIQIMAGSSLEEGYAASGISHLVEHMVFKGTKTRKAGDIEREVKSYGGIMNGSVSQDVTHFYIIVSPQYFEKAAALLKDMLLNANFDKNEFAKEKEVILKEIRLRDDEPQSRLMSNLNDLAYISHPYKYPVIGYEERFDLLTREDAVNYYNKMYVPNRMVIAVTGDVESAYAIDVVRKEFEDFRPACYDNIAARAPEPVQISTRERDDAMDINLAYLAMGFHSTSLYDGDIFAMDVLAMILGRGDNCRLTTSLFKKNRLVHSVTAWNYTPRDPGLFTVQAVLAPANITKAEDGILEEVMKVRSDGVSDSELEIAKRMVLADYIFSLQTIDAQASDLATSYIFTGSPDFSSKYVKGIQAVTGDDVRRAARKYLGQENLSVVCLIPKSFKKETPAAEKLKSEQGMTKHLLSNGLRVILRQDENSPTVSVTIAMLGGLMDETEKNNGISNLTAKMLLKGTSGRRESQIAGEIEGRGGSISAFSGFNAFGLSLQFLKDDMDANLAITADILLNSIFPEDEMDKERDRLLAMLKEEDDDIFQSGLNLLRRELFKDSPYGMRILGSPETLASISRPDLQDFYKKHAVSGNIVISISGDIIPASLIERLEKVFKDLPSGKATLHEPSQFEINEVRSKVFYMQRRQSLLLMGFNTVGIKNRDRYALDVLASVMSGQSGRLFKSIRGEESLAYTLGCANKTARDMGFFVFYVATVKSELDKAKEILLREIKRVKAQGPDDSEIASAQRELITAYLLSTQTNDIFALNGAVDELYGVGYDDIYNYVNEIKKVTKDDLKRVAGDYFNLGAFAEVSVISK